MAVPFTPTPDLAVILDHLLDIYERRGEAPKQVIRVKLADVAAELDGYYNQTDPLPRLTTNEQLSQLAERELVQLDWLPGQERHLLARVTLQLTGPEQLYSLLNRQPLADQRQRLRELLLGDRFRLEGWQRRVIEHGLGQLKAHKSPAPFSLADESWNRDLLAVLIALPKEETTEELPYRVFSVRLFNDSKRFETLKESVARLARRFQPVWKDLSPQETLRESTLR